MKTLVVSAISIVSMCILSCPAVIAFPPTPDDVQIVKPDLSLPKELSAFFGKWEYQDAQRQIFIIVEKIDEQKASLYFGRFGAYRSVPTGWIRYEAKVYKERGKYLIWFQGPFGSTELTLKGEYLNVNTREVGLYRYNRVQ